MHAWFKALLVGDALQQLYELQAFSAIQRGGELIFMLKADLPDLGQDLRASISEMQGVVTPVRGAAPAFQKAACFEPVDQRHDLAWGDAELICEGLLAAARLEGNEPQETCLLWGQV